MTIVGARCENCGKALPPPVMTTARRFRAVRWDFTDWPQSVPATALEPPWFHLSWGGFLPKGCGGRILFTQGGDE